MKFKDKLPKLRKENNITQEQLADMLGVSRQAVSKWESGLSIPDMEKIIEMCKIFNAPIEELLDDGVISNTKIEGKKDLTDYLNIILNFITKSYKMFCSMKFKEKIKCLFEITIIIGILIILFLIIGEILSMLIGNIINFLPYMIYDFISDIGAFIYIMFAFIAGGIITIHLFKVRYLNYFVIVDDKIEKTTEEERQILEKQKETIIIRDIKTHTSIIKKTFMWILKVILIFIAIPLLISFILITAATVFDLILIKDGTIFLGILIFLSGALIINYICLSFIYHFIFNLKHNFKRIFICIMTSLIALGAGAAIAFSSFLTFVRIDNNIEYKETTLSIDINNFNNLMLLESGWISEKDIVIDETVTDIEFDVNYLGTKPDIYTYELESGYYYIDIYSQEDPIFYINLVIKDFKNKNIRDYDELYGWEITEVRVSSKNLAKIK